ncbi:FxDxF family PEP-CTERM protein [Sphingomonas qilianensis]|uniref:FxDxF family PEP-CTERM protein n=1 Tax=Sphingomonas qilianensis TaxID=1736690 RepID=A0ABU9XTU0_9SPHN
MKNTLLGAAAFAAAICVSPVANAADFTPGTPQFQVFGEITNGTVSASIGNQGIAAGSFTDNFIFKLDQTGIGSGSLSTSTSIFRSVTDVDIVSVVINGLAATKIAGPNALVEFFSITGVPISFAATNTLTITGTSRGNGSYGGNLTFEPAVTAVPETATWAMMLFGFGLVGGVMRRRVRKSEVSFATSAA